jgi:ketosteroid isomerase-like protein
MKNRESALRERIGGLAQAIRDKNPDALMACYSPDVVVYDVYPPLEVRGAAAYRKNFERWFSSVQGPIGYDMEDLRVIQAEGHATCRCLSHVTARTTAGDPMDYWVRVTALLEDIGGQWLVTHEHISMPANRERE